MRCNIRGVVTRVLSALVLVSIATQTMAAGPAAAITAPHGEGGKIVRANGEVFISYTYIAAPGAVGTPAMFKVFRPRTDPPDGLQKPRLLAGDVGSWAFIGEGNLAAISAMMDLDANGVVTWTFMSIANLEKYRPAAAPPANSGEQNPAVSNVPDYDRAPGFPAAIQQANVPAATNSLGINGIAVDYLDSPNAQPIIYVDVGNGSQITDYQGFNDEGIWLMGNGVVPRSNNRPFTVKIVDGKAVITPRDALPRGLRHPSGTYLLDGPGSAKATQSPPVAPTTQSSGSPTKPPSSPATVPMPGSKSGQENTVANPANSGRGQTYLPGTLQEGYVTAAPNDLGIAGIFVRYGGSSRPSIKVDVGNGYQPIDYLGHNEIGLWASGSGIVTRANNKPFTIRMADGKAAITLRDAMPQGLHNPGYTYLVYGSGGSGTADGKSQRIMDLDLEAHALQSRLVVLAQQKLGRDGSASGVWNAYEQWKDQRDRGCLYTRPPLSYDKILDCSIAKTRELIALYQKALAELAADNLSAETGTAVGLK